MVFQIQSYMHGINLIIFWIKRCTCEVAFKLGQAILLALMDTLNTAMIPEFFPECDLMTRELTELQPCKHIYSVFAYHCFLLGADCFALPPSAGDSFPAFLSWRCGRRERGPVGIHTHTYTHTSIYMLSSAHTHNGSHKQLLQQEVVVGEWWWEGDVGEWCGSDGGRVMVGVKMGG